MLTNRKKVYRFCVCVCGLIFINTLILLHKQPISNSTIKSPGGNLVLANKQAAPKFSYVVWDEQGMVCILAKFEATLTITFYTPSGAHVSFFYFDFVTLINLFCDF